MPTSIKQVQVGNDYYDLENRFVQVGYTNSTSKTGTLTADQVNTLKASETNYIRYISNSNDKYIIYHLYYKYSSTIWYYANVTGDVVTITFANNGTGTWEKEEAVYVTEDWIAEQGFATESYVNAAIGAAMEASY